MLGSMKIKRWETIISDCDGLYSKELIDRGDTVWGVDFAFIVQDREGRSYEVTLKERGPYILVDEEHLTKYWNVIRPDTGWTFTVENSPLPSLFSGVIEANEVRHFVISTYDACLEILTRSEPMIRPRRSAE